MITDVNGVSTCQLGQEQYEIFHIHRKTRKGVVVSQRCQYDYRHTNGDLFSCIGYDLNDCRKQRDAWMKNHNYIGAV